MRKVVAIVPTKLEAEIMKGMLLANGIEASVQADDEGGMTPSLAEVQGIRLMVPEDQIDQAKALIQEAQSKEDRHLKVTREIE